MNYILDYEQVLQELDAIVAEGDIIKNCSSIGYSTYGLPIKHYSVGSGKYHIVVTGATHGSEIITTDFLLNLMKYLSSNSINLKNYTIHFIPMLNPEGYLISTSAVRQLIPRHMSFKDAQPIISEYVNKYNMDNENAIKGIDRNIKFYQDMFKNIDYTCISDNYSNLKQNIKELYYNNYIPKGTLQVWSSNGNGVDLNQNCPYNVKLKKLGDEQTFGYLKYNNIHTTLPGPIGCPSSSNNFKYEPETSALRDFIFNLKHDPNIELCAYFNYHSAEHTIYYAPVINHSKVQDLEKIKNMDLLEDYNFQISKLYSSVTGHKLMEASEDANCFNDLLRLQIPGDILVELCPNEGNPLSAYDSNFYVETIKSNIKAFINVLENLYKIYEVSYEQNKEKNI